MTNQLPALGLVFPKLKKKRAWTKKNPTPPPHCHLFYITRNVRDCTEKQQGRGKGNTQQTELGVWEKQERKSLSKSKLRNFREIRVYMVKITRKIGRKYLEKEMATHSSILAWKIPWTRSLVGYSPQGRRVRHEWVTWLLLFYSFEKLIRW